MKTPIEEAFALDFPDGEFPNGIWATAGRFGSEYGVFLGAFEEVQEFVPESRIAETIANLEDNGYPDLARLVEAIRGDVIALRAGPQKLVRDLAGRRICRSHENNKRRKPS